MFFTDKWARNKFIDKTVTSSPIDKTISFSSKSNWKLSSFSTIILVSGQLKKKSCMWFFTLVWLHNRAFAADWLLIVLTNCLKPQACPHHSWQYNDINNKMISTRNQIACTTVDNQQYNNNNNNMTSTRDQIAFITVDSTWN